MKSIDDIIAQEKTVDYQQRNKELFSYYTLTLIAQEQAARRTRRRLKLLLWFMLPALVGLLLSPATGWLINAVQVADKMSILRIVVMATASYVLAAVCVLALKRARFL